ncbi:MULTISPECIES: hypothetical protein [unclassified Streptomyces]|uniref:hypothetical protein n=2 Tax=unclassified Streptomyces TaxID=2593676 RepID=UPI0037D81EB0
MVRQAVSDVRAAAARRSVGGSRAHRAAPRVVDGLAIHTHQFGELMLEVAPPYPSDTEADVLAPLCDQIGDPLDNALAARRYVMSGDGRALHDTLL